MSPGFGRTPAASWVLFAAGLATAVTALGLVVSAAAPQMYAFVLVAPAAVLVTAVTGFLIPRAALAHGVLVIALILAGIGVLGQLAAAFTPAVLGTPAVVLLIVATALRIAGL